MATKKPDQPALAIGHIIVGVLALVVVSKFVRAPAARIILPIAAIAFHDLLDAPVSQAVSDDYRRKFCIATGRDW